MQQLRRITRMETILAKRQKELLQLMVNGYSIDEAAEVMQISHKTAKNSLIPVRKKLKVPTTLQAIMLLLRAGELEL
jgi:DNA-binding CsgD family transcriptional regulator